MVVHARWMQARAAEELRQANGAEVGRRAEEPGCSGAGGRGPLLTLEHHHLVLAALRQLPSLDFTSLPILRARLAPRGMAGVVTQLLR